MFQQLFSIVKRSCFKLHLLNFPTTSKIWWHWSDSKVNISFREGRADIKRKERKKSGRLWVMRVHAVRKMTSQTKKTRTNMSNQIIGNTTTLWNVAKRRNMISQRERQGDVKEVVQTKQGKAQSAPQTWITKGWQAHIDPLWLEHGLNINSKYTTNSTNQSFLA